VGIASMSERIEQLDGRLEIRSGDRGTTGTTVQLCCRSRKAPADVSAHPCRRRSRGRATRRPVAPRKPRGWEVCGEATTGRDAAAQNLGAQPHVSVGDAAGATGAHAALSKRLEENPRARGSLNMTST